MIETILHPRITENEDWATTLFVLSFAIIAITKSIFENRFGNGNNSKRQYKKSGSPVFVLSYSWMKYSFDHNVAKLLIFPSFFLL